MHTLASSSNHAMVESLWLFLWIAGAIVLIVLIALFITPIIRQKRARSYVLANIENLNRYFLRATQLEEDASPENHDALEILGHRVRLLITLTEDSEVLDWTEKKTELDEVRSELAETIHDMHVDAEMVKRARSRTGELLKSIPERITRLQGKIGSTGASDSIRERFQRARTMFEDVQRKSPDTSTLDAVDIIALNALLNSIDIDSFAVEDDHERELRHTHEASPSTIGLHSHSDGCGCGHGHHEAEDRGPYADPEPSSLDTSHDSGGNNGGGDSSGADGGGDGGSSD